MAILRSLVNRHGSSKHNESVLCVFCRLDLVKCYGSTASTAEGSRLFKQDLCAMSQHVCCTAYLYFCKTTKLSWAWDCQWAWVQMYDVFASCTLGTGQHASPANFILKPHGSYDTLINNMVRLHDFYTNPQC